MYLIDANIFLEYLMDQKRADEALKFLNAVVKGDLQVYVSRFCLYSIEIILLREKKAEDLEKFLEILAHAKGIKLISTSVADDREILQSMKKTRLDLDDAINYYICKSLNLKIVSFDSDFDKTDIKRLEPKDVKSR